MSALLIDEDVALDTAPELLRLGHDAVSVDALGRKGSKDDAVFWLAVQQRRLVVTHNLKDFELLHRAWHRWGVAGRHPGILVPQQSFVRRALAVAQAVDAFLSAGLPLGNELYILHARRGWECYNIAAAIADTR